MTGARRTDVLTPSSGDLAPRIPAAIASAACDNNAERVVVLLACCGDARARAVRGLLAASSAVV